MTETPLRRRGAAIAAALISAALILTACSGAPEETPSDDPGAASQTRQFEADNGTIEIPVDPQRIVALGSASVYLNLGVEPVGLGPKAREGDLVWLTTEQKAANDAAVDVGENEEIDYEEVASLEPDLIVVYDPLRVWEGGSYDEARLQSIAPTAYIAISNSDWKTQVGRLADAVGELDTFEADKNEYDSLVAEIKDEYADRLSSTTFTVLNRWTYQDAGSLTVEHSAGYCVTHLREVGLKTTPESRDIDGQQSISDELSMEQLSDTVADADVIIYPLVPGGEVKAEFEPVLESNIWQTLPQVQDGRAVGVQCNTVLTYSAKTGYLESLKEALATLPEGE